MVLSNKRGQSLETVIRLAGEADVPDIIALIMKQHGNYYPGADVYNEEFVRTAIKKEDLYVAVAELAGGILAGMTGANRENEFSGSLEFKMLTIRPSARGFSLGKHLLSFLLQILPPESFASIYGHCMSLDTASQGICAGLGYRLTGMIMNCYRIDAQAEHFAGLDLPVKHNLVIACLPGNKKDSGVLYAPAAHAAYIEGIYRDLGAAYTLREDEGAEPAAAVSLCTVIKKDEHLYCALFVEKAGLDIEEILTGVLEQYGNREDRSFNAFINLNDPACPWLCRIMEDRGFFFTGIQPLAGRNEYMVLHYSPDLPVPFERIKILPEFAGAFACIRGRYEESR